MQMETRQLPEEQGSRREDQGNGFSWLTPRGGRTSFRHSPASEPRNAPVAIAAIVSMGTC